MLMPVGCDSAYKTSKHTQESSGIGSGWRKRLTPTESVYDAVLSAGDNQEVIRVQAAHPPTHVMNDVSPMDRSVELLIDPTVGRLMLPTEDEIRVLAWVVTGKYPATGRIFDSLRQQVLKFGHVTFSRLAASHMARLNASDMDACQWSASLRDTSSSSRVR
jgi:hypothetical protein